MASFTQTDHFVRVQGHKLDISIIEPSGKSKGSALFLHGGGETSTKQLHLPLAKALAQLGYKGLVFSYPGHGKSTGKIVGSSLSKRVTIAKELAIKLGFFPGTLLCASSMGAHIALRLAGDNFHKLALFVPAVYAAEAEDVPFGAPFSEILRKPESYKNSLALESLRVYEGKLIIFQAGRDKIIPPEAIDLIWKKAVSVESKDKVVFDDSPHGISDWIYQSEDRLTSVVKALKK